MKKEYLIFIVEDSAIVRELIEFSLKRSIPCTVKKFEDIKSAWRAFKINSPDVVILDYFLDTGKCKFTTGLIFLRLLRFRKIKVPVVVFSGQTNQALVAELMKAGATSYISKNSEHFIEELIFSTENLCRMKA